MRDAAWGRRRFLQQAASMTASGLWLSGQGAIERAIAAEAQATAAELVAGKDRRLIVRSAAPIEIETPLALLVEHKVTPADLLFVRNNQALASSNTLRPISPDEWSIEIDGLTERPAKIAVRELAELDQVEHELVLQCSGNGRAVLSKIAPAKGAQWQCGAMGNVRFRGAPLAKVFDHLKLNVRPSAQFLTAEGRDAPSKPDEADFEHSIPLADALARSILALEMNGEPIPAIHGGPVRLVTPGYYATMNVKWLSRLRLEEHETANYHQVRRYRTPKEPIKPGSDFTYDLANSDANWRMRVKSVIFSPLEGARVPAGRVQVSGVAWNDGSAAIERVLVASGDGAAWQAARLEPSASPYAWRHWQVSMELARGEHRLSALAIDALGRSQPLAAAPQWNPAGYACSAADVVRVIAD
jgi:DMSO/TMAO reductase YedYZ molybdopterin-dependent catalytic subunit